VQIGPVALMAFALLADKPETKPKRLELVRDDAVLKFGNSATNIRRILARLDQHCPGLTPKEQKCLADILASGTIEGLGQDRPLHFSRKKATYVGRRYKHHDYETVIRTVDKAEKLGLIHQKKGKWDQLQQTGNESTLWLTNDTLAWTRGLVNPRHSRAKYRETIVLKKLEKAEGKERATALPRH
jgi:hypothetical protein